jgi:hypothetical protein
MTLEAEILFGNITISVLYRFINFKAVMATWCQFVDTQWPFVVIVNWFKEWY